MPASSDLRRRAGKRAPSAPLPTPLGSLARPRLFTPPRGETHLLLVGPSWRPAGATRCFAGSSLSFSAPTRKEGRARRGGGGGGGSASPSASLRASRFFGASFVCPVPGSFPSPLLLYTPHHKDWKKRCLVCPQVFRPLGLSQESAFAFHVNAREYFYLGGGRGRANSFGKDVAPLRPSGDFYFYFFFLRRDLAFPG